MVAALVSAVACGPGEVANDGGTTTNPGTSATSDGDGDGDGDDDGDGDGDDEADGPGGLDLSHFDLPPGPCTAGDCSAVDILFVIDNSSSMTEEQLNLANNLPLLLDKLRNLPDSDGEPLDLDVQIMVTTTDVGHPLCVDAPPGYEPAVGAPITTACIDRLDEFIGPDAQSYAQACELGCPAPVVPMDPFIAFDSEGTNVPGDDVEGAFACLAPQGVVGCEFESPLEAMLQAISPAANWNMGDRPFVRQGAALVIVLISDEPDCSVRPPEGYAYFTDPNFDTYWPINPETMTKTHATSAVCFRASADCGPPDQNGVYADCTPVDTGVLHPIDRYLTYLGDALIDAEDKQIMILAALGVPEVTAHNPQPPFEPIAGGVADLVYRQWIDGAWPSGDLLPGTQGDAASQEFEYGIGPGCTGTDGMGGFTGQAMPPLRVKEVCEGLNEDDQLRCCIESICDPDFSDLINCLSPITGGPPLPPG